MTAFVTGATGFIGQHLVAKLLENGQKVRILTRDRRRVSEQWHGAVEVLTGDLLNRKVLDSALADVSVLFNLAGEIRDKALFRSVNEVGVQNLLEGCLRKAYLFAVLARSTQSAERAEPT